MNKKRIQEIHFIRQVLDTGYDGKQTAVMQFSNANTYALHPHFVEAPFYEQDDLTALYHKLGGGRNDGDRMGVTIILPERSRWERLWQVSPEQVEVLDYAPASNETQTRATRREQTRIRNHLMRD